MVTERRVRPSRRHRARPAREWNATDIPSLEGRTYVVTGGNRGIGLAITTALAVRGGRVLVGCRNVENGNVAVKTITDHHEDADVRVVRLDLADLGAVQGFADHVMAKLDRIDALINNAGVMIPPFTRTADGFELQFGTNVLGHFALTGHLMPLLRSSGRARVVSVTSLVQRFARIDFANLNAEKRYGRMRAYKQSKLANLVFAYELQRRLEQDRAEVISVAAHPGITQSDLARHSRAIEIIMPLVAQPAQGGALPSLVAATASDIQGGDFVGPGGLLTMRGNPRRENSSARSRDAILGARLWEAAQSLTGVTYL